MRKLNKISTTLQVREDIKKQVIEAVIPADLRDPDTVYHINPCGTFITGGPMVGQGLVFTFYSWLIQSKKSSLTNYLFYLPFHFTSVL